MTDHEKIGFGIDFGTTNSVAAVFNSKGLTAYVEESMKLPHPSILWYRGSEKPIVGREAKNRIKDLSNTPGHCFVKSVKSHIGRDIEEIEIFGEQYETWRVASEIFSFLKQDAQRQYAGHAEIEEAVVTIPLNFNGKQRKQIRQAANQANIHVKSFIHEPFAAVIQRKN
jgi:molecular chaperone DnaK